jgi:flap endonuclease-1
MGIHGLMKLISEECPGAIKEQQLENFTGRKIAIDASMAMYQFLIAVRFGPDGGQAGTMLTNEAGEVTSHIQGMFNRTIKLMTSGIKPVFVFDGKPPQLKGGELAKRLARRAKAQADLAEATEQGQVDDMDRFSRRLVKVTKQHNDDCKELLRLMGVPVITAPCEAEAQCSELAKKGKVYGTATEDMDALTFKSPKLIRKLTFSQSSKEKQPILEIDFDTVIKGLGLEYEQFVDLCILCGCDYCSTIKGIGPKTALKLIKQYKNLETIVNVLKKEKRYTIPHDWFPQRVRKNGEDEEVNVAVAEVEGKKDGEEADGAKKDNEGDDKKEGDDQPQIDEDEDGKIDLDDGNVEFPSVEDATTLENEEENPEILEDDENYETIPPMYVQARQLFLQCEVDDGNSVELKWNEPDEKALITFLVDRMGFNAERVSSGIKRLKEAQQSKSQKRMDW